MLLLAQLGDLLCSRLCYCIVVQCTSSITAPKRPPPVIQSPTPSEEALLGVGPAWNWGILFRATLFRNEREVRRWVADEKRRRAADEKLRRRIRELPVSAPAA